MWGDPEVGWIPKKDGVCRESLSERKRFIITPIPIRGGLSYPHLFALLSLGREINF